MQNCKDRKTRPAGIEDSWSPDFLVEVCVACKDAFGEGGIHKTKDGVVEEVESFRSEEAD